MNKLLKGLAPTKRELKLENDSDYLVVFYGARALAFQLSKHSVGSLLLRFEQQHKQTKHTQQQQYLHSAHRLEIRFVRTVNP